MILPVGQGCTCTTKQVLEKIWNNKAQLKSTENIQLLNTIKWALRISHRHTHSEFSFNTNPAEWTCWFAGDLVVPVVLHYILFARCAVSGGGGSTLFITVRLLSTVSFFLSSTTTILFAPFIIAQHLQVIHRYNPGVVPSDFWCFYFIHLPILVNMLGITRFMKKLYIKWRNDPFCKYIYDC